MYVVLQFRPAIPRSLNLQCGKLAKKPTEEGKDLPQAALAMEDGPDGCAEGQGFMVVRFRARSGKDSIPDSACPLGVHNLQASVFCKASRFRAKLFCAKGIIGPGV